MRIDLKVPYEEKNEAKRLGAFWDPARKTWYVVDKANLRPFLRWIPKRLTAPHQINKEK